MTIPTTCSESVRRATGNAFTGMYRQERCGRPTRWVLLVAGSEFDWSCNRHRDRLVNLADGIDDVEIVEVEKVNGDEHGNEIRREGVDRCACGSKYWENDRCIDCGSSENVQLTEEGKVS